MKNCFKKFSLMFVMALVLVLGSCVSAFADDNIYSDNLIPKMTGYTNGNITVSASAYYTPHGELCKPWHAFDRNNTQDWDWYCNANPLPSEGSHWIKVDFGISKCISKITMTCASVHSSVKNFKLQGSNDNSDWKDLYTGTNKRYDGIKSEFTFDNANSYRYYRLLVLDSYSSYGKTYCGIDELEMMEKLSESISLNKSTDNLQIGQADNLIATTTPSAVEVVWSSSNTSVATVDSTGKVTGVKEGQATIIATTTDDATATCVVTVTKNTEPTNPQPTGTDNIVNIAHAKGDNTNNASGEVSIIFNGVADTQLSVVKTADVKSVYVGDIFTYTIVVTNTGLKTAKSVVINDSAPNHIDFTVDGITTTQGKVDQSSTSKNIIVNVGDIPPSGTVTIKIPVTVIL